jgi:hypothetical protein
MLSLMRQISNQNKHFWQVGFSASKSYINITSEITNSHLDIKEMKIQRKSPTSGHDTCKQEMIVNGKYQYWPLPIKQRPITSQTLVVI